MKMSPEQIGALGFLFILGLTILMVGAILKMHGREHGYNEGWEDCEKLHKGWQMSEDDEVVLKHLKSALRAYIGTKRYQRKGDIKRIVQTRNFDELREITWEICEREKFEPKGKKKNV